MPVNGKRCVFRDGEALPILAGIHLRQPLVHDADGERRQTPNRVRSGKCNEKQEADTAEP